MVLIESNEYSFTTKITSKLYENISLISKQAKTDLFLVKTAPSVADLVSSSSLTSPSSDSKLIDSISLLKNIIDKISKVSYENARDNTRKHDASDSIDNLFALAKSSVTLSFKDYILMQKSTGNSLNTNFNNQQYRETTISTSTFNSTMSTNSFLSSSKTASHLVEMLKSFTKNTTLSSYNDYVSLQSSLLSRNSSSFDDYSLKGDDLELELFNDPLNNLRILASNNSSLLFGIAFFYSILIITSLTSNPLLIYVLLWRRKAQIKLIDIFVANLSLSDLFLTILNIPLCLIIYFSEQWPFGSLLCQLGTFSTSCSIYVNIFTMAYISIDRYFAVTRPLISNPNCQLRKKSILVDNHTRHKIYLVLTLIWIIAIVLSLPQFLFSKVSSHEIKSPLDKTGITEKFNSTFKIGILDEDTNSGSHGIEFGEDPFKRCIIEYPYKNMKNIMVFVNFSLQYLIPSIVILYFYGKIIYHLYLNLNIEELMESPNNNPTHKKDSKTSHCVKSKSDFEVNKSGAQQTVLNMASSSATEINAISKPTKVIRKKSRMRIEGFNRTRNLKKSIKTMIIIIALFLLSWLPIHLYRMATTYYPIILNYLNNFSPVVDEASTLSLNLTSLNNNTNHTSLIEICLRNSTNKDCLMNALKGLRDSVDSSNLNFKINTLHNRYVFFFCYFMAMSSVCYNPIVYFWMHKKFRAEVKVLFSRMCSFTPRIRRIETRTTSITPSTHGRCSTLTTSTQANFSKGTKFSILSKQSTLNTEYENVEGNEVVQRNSKVYKKKTKKRDGQPWYMTSISIRNKRFSSLSSESTASSCKRSEF